jgi:NADH-quinone oxidoreductase subunit E
MTFSPQLEQRFAKMLQSYPEGRKRSAVVPMLIYAQDETGAITPELIDEVAKRCEVAPLQVDEVVGYYSMLHRKPLGKYHVQVCTNISCLLVGGEELYQHACKKLGLGHKEVAKRCEVAPLQVDEVVGYYSMLHRKPLGKYHVQVCTNISCMLVGGTELYEHACKKLGIGHKEVTADGQFSLEEVECIGACSWAPAIQVNYDFHHNVTPEKLDKLLDDLRKLQGAQ